MRQFEGLEGGELAAALTPAVRMDMVSKGYNAMSPADVQRYFAKQKPVDGLHEVAGVREYKNLGGGIEVAASDAGLLQSYEQETGVSLAGKRTSGNPREDVRSMMDNYGAGLGNLDDKMTGLVERGMSQRKEQRVLGPGTTNRNPNLISTPKQTLPIITEAAKAKKVGYMIGIKYINAFIANIKAPSAANRMALMKEMNNMVLIEDKIAPALLKEYRQGIAIAENELHQKITKNNG